MSICKFQQIAKVGIEVKCRKRLFITPHYWFFILLAGIVAIIVLQILSCLSQQKQIHLLEAIREAEASGIALVVERLAEIQEVPEEIHGDEKLSEERALEGEIIVMLTEQMVNDYTERAIEYFREADYANAAHNFDRALRHRRRNTTLMFYHTYALYLGQRNRTLTMDELASMQTRIRELQEIGFREEEKIDFSVAEMEQKVHEMRYNIGERR